MEITAYVTRPVTKAEKHPLVVMPHGGPEARDAIAFDPIVQAFAAQGWLVLQPNFRGSYGYGKGFAEAGHRQWSRRMQDDVTDSVNDLVQAGIVAPDKIVIYGISYGGYAALAGAVVTPELYRGAISRAGISDLGAFLRYQHYRDDLNSHDESLLYNHWVNLIGDPKTDAAALHAGSPSERAAEIRIPIMLMHGTADQIGRAHV